MIHPLHMAPMFLAFLYSLLKIEAQRAQPRALFSIPVHFLGDLICNNGFKWHLYAKNVQAYVSGSNLNYINEYATADSSPSPMSNRHTASIIFPTNLLTGPPREDPLTASPSLLMASPSSQWSRLTALHPYLPPCSFLSLTYQILTFHQEIVVLYRGHISPDWWFLNSHV